MLIQVWLFNIFRDRNLFIIYRKTTHRFNSMGFFMQNRLNKCLMIFKYSVIMNKYNWIMILNGLLFRKWRGLDGKHFLWEKFFKGN